MTDKKDEFDKIITPVGRLSFPSVFEATCAPNSTNAKWSTVFLIPKTTNIQEIKDLLKRAVAKKYPDGNIPKNSDGTPFVTPIKDGNDKTYEGYADHYFFTASTKNRAPGVVDETKKPIMDRNEIYAGCYAVLQINAYCWEYMGKYGVSIGLQHVMKWKDGEPLSGGSSAEDAFSDLDLPEAAAVPQAVGGGLSILD